MCLNNSSPRSTLILLSILLLNFCSIAQVEIKNGILNDSNEVVYSDTNQVSDSFAFKKSFDNKQIVCLMKNSNGKLSSDLLIWDIVFSESDEKSVTFSVIDADLHNCVISFFKNENLVIILDVDDEKALSTMTGNGLTYSDILP